MQSTDERINTIYPSVVGILAKFSISNDFEADVTNNVEIRAYKDKLARKLLLFLLLLKKRIPKTLKQTGKDK